jgi:thiamine biosynthesis lipoprotein
VINPRTGYPVTYWQSVTVLAQSAFTAGSRSTIAMLKEGEGLAFLEKNGLKYMAIDSLGEMYYRN